MGERRILVIGSQCDRFGPLSFLPEVAQDLYAVMTDPQLGGCVSALEGHGLVYNPLVRQAKEVLQLAFARASEDGATLFLAFIGHGLDVAGDFYFLPNDASRTPDSESGVHLVQRIKELRSRHSNVDGLVVLLDCCYAGVAAAAAASQWVDSGDTLEYKRRFELLSAVADRPAADGCFSRSLVRAIRSGLAEIPNEFVRCEHIKPVIEKLCPKQAPQHPTQNAEGGLYLSRNAASYEKISTLPWSRTESVATEIYRLTAYYEPIAELREIVVAAQGNRCLVVEGELGSGKSALAAALARPEVTGGRVPTRFVQAAYFISELTDPQNFAAILSGQLLFSISEFGKAKYDFGQSMPQQEFKALAHIERELVGPLRFLPMDCELRLVIDGLDRLPIGASVSIRSALEQLATDTRLSNVRLLLTALPNTRLPNGVTQHIKLMCSGQEDFERYLCNRSAPADQHHAIIEMAAGNWLIAYILTNAAMSGQELSAAGLPETLRGNFERLLYEAGAGKETEWKHELGPVLASLAAAGVGPVLPIPLLSAASEELGGPSGTTKIRNALVKLQGVVVRSVPGTAEEHAGIFHQRLAEYILTPGERFGIDPSDPHGALITALSKLTSAAQIQENESNPVLRYAFWKEAAHLWQLKRYEEAIKSLARWVSPIPLENLNRWRSWL